METGPRDILGFRSPVEYRLTPDLLHLMDKSLLLMVCDWLMFRKSVKESTRPVIPTRGPGV